MTTKRSSLSSMVPATETPCNKPRSPRWAMFNSFVDEGVRHLTTGAVTVWIILYRSADGKGLVRMSQEGIAERAGLSVRHVKRMLTNLHRQGYVTELSRGTRNSGPSRYRIHAVSTGQIRPLENTPQTGQIRPLEDIHNGTDTSPCKGTHMSPSSERIIKTPPSAKAGSAEEGDLRTKPVEIGGIK